ncbi:MAG: ATP-binding protein [Treponema sp.]|nr:ATP-binding protein [Treponema sp.]
MLNDETKRKLRELKLGELIEGYDIYSKGIEWNSMSFEQKFQLLSDYLFQEKYNNSVKLLLSKAKLRIPKAEVTSLIYDGRGIDRSLITELSSCQYISSAKNIVFQGFTGSGKTYLACALGKQACKLRFSTKYIRLPDLLVEYDEEMLMRKNAKKLLKRYSTYSLLIVDEWLMDDISEKEQHFIFELIERRHEQTSTIFCTQYKREDWFDRLGGGVHADAILDRIVHNAIFVETGSMNMREYCSKLSN